MQEQIKLREIEEWNIKKHHGELAPWDLAVLESLVRPIKIDLSLGYLLGGLNKDELSSIRRWLGLPGASKLKKDDLRTALQPWIIAEAPRHLGLLDEHSLSLIQALLEQGGVLKYDFQFGLHLINFLRQLGLVYPGYHAKRGMILIMPRELQKPCRDNLTPAVLQQVARNEEIARLIEGMLRYYGVMKESDAYDRLKGFVPDLTIRYYFTLLDGLGASRGNIAWPQDQDDYMAHKDVIDWQAIQREQEQRPWLPYLDIDSERLQAAATDRRELWNRHHRELVKFLQTKGASQPEAEEMTDYAYFFLLNETNLGKILQGLAEELHLTEEDLQPCLDRLVAIYNNSPQWKLKGYSPLQVRRLRADAPPEPVPPSRKVGRNELCPCGSGKKYKHCCGKPDWLG